MVKYIFDLNKCNFLLWEIGLFRVCKLDVMSCDCDVDILIIKIVVDFV